MKCKSIISNSKAKVYAHPNERDLVILQFKKFSNRIPSMMFHTGVLSNFQYRFAFVESLNRSFLDASSSRAGQTSTDTSFLPECELDLSLKVSGMDSLTNLPMEGTQAVIKVVGSLTTMIRQWNALINLHGSQLVRDILNPRGSQYFCLSNPQQPTPKEVFSTQNVRQL